MGSAFDEETPIQLTIDKTKIGLEFVGKNIPFYLPSYATQGSSGVDLRADIPSPLKIKPNEIYMFPTGIKLNIPFGWEAQVRSRSGLAVKFGAHVLHGMGTIDSDYTGEIQMIMATIKPFEVNPGDKIAQMVFAKVEQVLFEIEVIGDKASRGSNGFGSTGV